MPLDKLKSSRIQKNAKQTSSGLSTYWLGKQRAVVRPERSSLRSTRTSRHAMRTRTNLTQPATLPIRQTMRTLLPTNAVHLGYFPLSDSHVQRPSYRRRRDQAPAHTKAHRTQSKAFPQALHSDAINLHPCTFASRLPLDRLNRNSASNASTKLVSF